MLHLTCSFVEEYDPTIGKVHLLLLTSFCFANACKFCVHSVCFQQVIGELMCDVMVR